MLKPCLLRALLVSLKILGPDSGELFSAAFIELRRAARNGL